jgi:2-polyprenyl-6-methoxyphenol hydroxylase-like FAD-dependent oxidoreductase
MPTVDTVDNVLIAGGGLAGMTLAIGLNQAGIGAEIVEINPRWTGLAPPSLCKARRSAH